MPYLGYNQTVASSAGYQQDLHALLAIARPYYPNGDTPAQGQRLCRSQPFLDPIQAGTLQDRAQHQLQGCNLSRQALRLALPVRRTLPAGAGPPSGKGSTIYRVSSISPGDKALPVRAIALQLPALACRLGLRSANSGSWHEDYLGTQRGDLKVGRNYPGHGSPASNPQPMGGWEAARHSHEGSESQAGQTGRGDFVLMRARGSLVLLSRRCFCYCL